MSDPRSVAPSRARRSADIGARSIGDLAASTFRRLARDAASAARASATASELTNSASQVALCTAAVCWAERHAGLSLGTTAERHAGLSLGTTADRPSLEQAWQELSLQTGLGPSRWQVPAWVRGSTLGAVVDESGACVATRAHPLVLGELYEALTALALERADGPSICVAPTGVWISARAVHEQPASVRSKWLQRRARLPKTAVAALKAPLASARSVDEVVTALQQRQLRGTQVAPDGALLVQSSLGRRQAGAHYTPLPLAERVAERTLGPIVEGLGSDDLLDLRICDPAVGAGVFLYAALDVLARRLHDAWRSEGRADGRDDAEARRLVFEHCLCGIDRDPRAVEVARLTLALGVLRAGARPTRAPRFAVGNAVLDTSVIGEDAAAPIATAFGDAFDREPPGFDAIVGNPPWVAYVGRAAQPLAPAIFERYLQSPAFRGYRTLQGLFVWKAATLLRPGGRLGLVLPTSMADLDGYAPTRAAHDALAEADPELFDFGDGAFDEVFQPCMALTSTRRPTRVEADGAPWPLERSDLTCAERALLDRLAALPTLPRELFGERGYQTTGDDLAHLRDRPRGPEDVALRTGGDVFEFRLAEPTCYADPADLSGTLRPSAAWSEVRVLIRQTARYPIAALSDGRAFRNSVLAGFESERWPPPALLAYLNSSPVRWYHYQSRRDARQGMPQLKIAHLRALPDLADGSIATLVDFGQRVASSAASLPSDQRRELDQIVARGWALSESEAQLVRAWAETHPPPAARARPADKDPTDGERARH